MANDNIFQQYLTPPKSVLDYTADLDAAEQRKQATKINALALATGQQKYDEGVQSSQRAGQVRNALSSLGAGATDDDRIRVMRGTSTPEGFAAADSLEKALSERGKAKSAMAKDDADTAKTNLTRDITLHDFHAQKLAQVRTPQEALAWAEAGKELGLFKQPGQYERGVAAIQQASTSPEEFAKWRNGAMQGGMSVTEQLKAQMEALKQQEQVRQANQTDARIKAEGQANRSQSERHFNTTQNGDAGSTLFTPEAIANAAARYNVDGTLPPMGMGKSGSAGRAAILNEAARQATGIDPADQRRNQMNAKGEAQANAASQRAYSAQGTEGKAIQAANTGLNHLETVEQMAMAQKNGNMPLFNKLANNLARATGQAAPTNMAAAVTMVSPEISKAVIGAAGGQAEREEFSKNFNPNASPDQLIGGIGVIKELMGGRLTESQRTYERTVKKKDFRDTMLSPAAQRVLDKAHSASNSESAGVKSGGAKPSLNEIFGK